MFESSSQGMQHGRNWDQPLLCIQCCEACPVWAWQYISVSVLHYPKGG